MSWWGKVIGGTFGFVMGGPLGAVLGAALGNYFDQGLQGLAREGFEGGGAHERVQTAFFTTVFSLMGYIAKADGRVSRAEISLAEQVMGQMRLNADQRKLAIRLFEQGKAEDFPVQDVLSQFRRECHRRHTLIQMFLEIIVATAFADGTLDASERKVLETIASALGVPAQAFAALVQRLGAQYRFQDDQRPEDRLRDAYRSLGLEAGADTAEVKRAYRKLMSQHHPDKLVSKGLPEEMMEIAKKKTQEIKAAYETIMAQRGE